MNACRYNGGVSNTTLLEEIRRIALLAGLLLPTALLAQDRLPAPVAQALKAAGVPQASVAVLVQEVDARMPRASFNADKPMNPASVMKLVTTYAALELLGPAYAWKTEAYALGPINDGVLEGDLAFKGYGDPKFGFEQFWLLLRQLRDKGLREIRGNLLLDRSHFASTAHDPARFDGEPLRPYNVGPDALLVNYKAVRLSFAPDAARRILTVSAEPFPPQFDLVNLVKLTDGTCGSAWYEGIRMDLAETGAVARLILTGSYPAACGEKTRSVSVMSHPQFVAGVFRQLWKELGGTFNGGLREGILPAEARLLARGESPALAEVVRDINKFSNNVMTRQIFLTLAAEKLGAPGTLEKGRQVMADALARRGLDFPELRIGNGAGLSRDNRISARSLGRLLLAARNSPFGAEFQASLSLAGLDGTTRRRFQKDSLAGQMHLKTGTLDGVSAIAGYVRDQSGAEYVVVAIANQPKATWGGGQEAQNALLRWVNRL